MSVEERDFLLQSLRDLDAEREAGDLDEPDYSALRDEYTARAAAVIRELETATPSDFASDSGHPTQRHSRKVGGAGRRRRSTAWWVAAVAIAAAAAGSLVASGSGPRLPGQATTGSIVEGTTDRLVRARALIGEGKAVDAVKLYDRILADDPRQPEALAYRGWLLRLAGLPDEGLVYIDRAVAADPGYADAHFFRGMILWQDRKDPAAGAAEFRLFLANDPPPDMVSLVQDALARADAEAAGAPTPAAGP